MPYPSFGYGMEYILFCGNRNKTMIPKSIPHIAIIAPNTLVCIGLRTIVMQVFPMAQIAIYTSLAEVRKNDLEFFFHYFITPGVLQENPIFFSDHSHKTIVLVNPSSTDWALYAPVVKSYHTLDISLKEEDLSAEVIHLARRRADKAFSGNKAEHRPTPLTVREQEVLRLIVRGMMNKEIASSLGISLTTAISHRRKIQEKLRIRSTASLTLYAVMHGLCTFEH